MASQEIDPASLSAADRYKLLIGLITPRPIAWVSTVDPEGRSNLAPFSFFNGVGSDPMLLLFCPANKPDGTEKDSLRNAKPPSDGGTGEFVVNTVPHALGAAMSATAAELPHGESEWDFASKVLGIKLEMEPSKLVRPARIKQSPACFECKTLQVIRTNPGHPGGGNIVIGQVVFVRTHEGVLNERFHASPEVLDHIGRLGGMGYSTTRDRFDMNRG